LIYCLGVQSAFIHGRKSKNTRGKLAKNNNENIRSCSSQVTLDFDVQDITAQDIVLLARTYKGISVLQTSKRKNFNETLM
jgi:hypothetical protein